MGCAQDAATRPRVVHTVAELQMALADKARGQNIARLRARKRLTQQALADKLKVGYRTVQTWESGTMPEWPNLEKLARALDVRPEDIIGDEPAPEPSQLGRIEESLAELHAKVDRLAEDVDDTAQAVTTAVAELAVRLGEVVRADSEAQSRKGRRKAT